MDRSSLRYAYTDDGRTVAGVRTSDIVPWWSVTKTVLAAAALQLAAELDFDLDAPLDDAPYSLRQLLAHRAGLRSYGGMAEYHEAVGRGDQPWPRDEMLARTRATDFASRPGEGWAYSNIGYMRVVDWIRDNTNQPIDIAVRQRVLDPLKIGTARFATKPDDLDESAWGNPSGYHPGWVYHGLLIGSVGDAALMMHRLLTGKLLSAEHARAMIAAHPLGGPIEGRPWLTTSYGLGLMIGDMAGAGHAVGHSASGPGSVGAVYHYPALQVPRTVAVFGPFDHEGRVETKAAELAVA